MMKWNLRTKVLLSMIITIFVVLATSTLINIYFLQRDYFEAIEWRSEALAQSIINEITNNYMYMPTTERALEMVSLQCTQLYESSKDKGVIHIAVISKAGTIAAHNNKELWKTPLKSPLLLEQLKHHEKTTVLDGTIYHTLIPIQFRKTYLGTIDIGVSKGIVDEKIQQILFNAVVLLVLSLLLTFFIISLLMHALLTKPIRRLVKSGQQLAKGNLSQAFLTTGGGDEISILGATYNRIASYLQSVAEVASNVANGVLDSEVDMRSEHDTLGKSVHEMLGYLKHVLTVSEKIAQGDLTETVRVRSTTDAFGQAIQAMTEGLKALIKQIKTSAQQIALTGKTIAAFAEHDIKVVQNVYASAEQMIFTMQEIGTSIGDVAQGTDNLSASIEETSAAMSQMTSSIAHIASNTVELNERTHQTIEFLEGTVNFLEGVVKSTDMSKQLSQETIQNALEGQQAVEQVMRGMETIQNTVTTAMDSITRFAQRSQDIDTILTVIQDITEQTSLLALNAAIIAAQAGVHGRGFAVVADEIKSLADGVSSSTKDIAAIVKSLQQDTGSVVQIIHAGAEDVKQGMERTQQAREALQTIIASAQRSSAVVTEITDRLHQLATTTRNISTAMEQVHTLTDDITSATAQQNASTKNINEAVRHIEKMIFEIQEATTSQLNGVQQMLNSTKNVTTLIDENLESSQKISKTTEALSSQADILLHSVDRFRLNAE